MKLSFITDEVTQDFQEAIAFAKEQGLTGLELRSVDDCPIHTVSAETARIWRQQLDEEGLQVSNLAGSFYKSGTTREELDGELQKLEKLCILGDSLDCHTIRGFAFFREGDAPAAPEMLVPYFAEATVLLKKYGKKLILEADPSVNTPNHRSLCDLLDLLDPEYFGAVYDPGNNLFDPYREEPFPYGYETIASHLCHVHVKDAVYDEAGEPRCVAPGQGLVRYAAMLSRLKADGYDGWLSLEPHYRKDVILTEEQMKRPSGATFSAGGMEAGKESARALHSLLAELNWKPE